VLLMAISRRRAGQYRALLRLLAAATRSRQPLGPAVAAFAQESQGVIGRQALRLYEALQGGSPLPAALAVAGPLTPSRQCALLYMGLNSDELASALDEAADEHEPDDVSGEIMAHVAYVFWIVAFGCLILTFVMLKIVPAFQQIFEDFNMELPAMTELLITFSGMAGASWPLLTLSLFALLGAFLYSLLIYIGLLRWRMPLPLRWARGLETSAVLRGLALAAEGQQPLEQGVETLAAAYPDRWTRQKLAQVSSDVAAGTPWWESLWRRQLISNADRSLLQAAQRLGNVPWALRTLSERHRWRMTYRLRWWLQLLGPPLLIGTALLVGFVVLSLFLPLIKLIETLT
jgi:type II secretory pathway component PulF